MKRYDPESTSKRDLWKEAMKSWASLAVLAGLLSLRGLVQAQEPQNWFLNLCQSATEGQIRQALGAGADANAKDMLRQTPLMKAAEFNPNAPVITALVKAGADVHAQDAEGRTALMKAAMFSRHIAVITNLVVSGAQVNAKDSHMETPLLLAVRFDAPVDVITTLIQCGADVNYEAPVVGTALISAADKYSPNLEVVAALVKAGANVNFKTKEGLTALIAAAEHNNKPDCLNALVKAGATVKAAMASGFSAICGAARYNRSAGIITALVKAGADVDCRTKSEVTPLMLAAFANPSVDVTLELIKAGADVNLKTGKGLTALMTAAKYSQTIDVVMALIKAGADTKAKDDDGKSVADYARQNAKITGLEEIIRTGATQSAVAIARQPTSEVSTDFNLMIGEANEKANQLVKDVDRVRERLAQDDMKLERINHFGDLMLKREYAQVIKDYGTGQGINDFAGVIEFVAISHKQLGDRKRSAYYYAEAALCGVHTWKKSISDVLPLLNKASNLDPENTRLQEVKKELHIQ